MFRKTRLKRTIAIFLLANMVFYIFTPLVAHASLTAGPTAPEYTSFEPVDTTDMVNLATGDFTYNIPLLEVPGPEGGYPLSLSYHAGIQPNEEASWVGLGWTLNPGAINRTVNGYADDHNQINRVRHDYNPGGKRHTLTVGVGIPGGSFGISASYDTNMGFGFGHQLSVGVPVFSNASGSSSIGLGVSAGFDSYGGVQKPSITPSVNIGAKFAKGQGNLAINSNFSSIGVGYTNGAISTGIRLSSKGVKGSFGLAGFSARQINNNAGKITTQGFNFTLPTPWGFTLGYNYLRYYSDEKDNVYTIGAVHFDEGSNKSPDDYALDSYVLNESLIDEENDPEKERGGSLPAYDAFQVSAQGLNGSIQPYIFENGSLFRQNMYDPADANDPVITYNKNTSFTKKAGFRFKNDFANSNTYGSSMKMVFDFDNSNSELENENRSFYAEGYDAYNKRLTGSKHIEWFTNDQIAQDIAKDNYGFIDFDNHNSYGKAKERETVLSDELKDQIGGFMITNESGVTYHYALPAYVFDEYSKTFVTESPGTYSEIEEQAPYAYNWLLTAITGPDFVDRGGGNNVANGVLDDDDWGYWVKFDYGLWAPQYRWANPVNGTHMDLDQKVSNYSTGKKELYYLNSISTRSHVAIFEKDVRADARGIAHLGDNNTNSHGDKTLINYYANPQEAYHQFSATSMRLNRIALYTKDKMEEARLGDIKSDGGEWLRTTEHYVVENGTNYTPTLSRKIHDPNSVIDVEDFATDPDLISDALRIIEFDQDYSLVDQTPNSYDEAQEILDTSVSNTASMHETKSGKLTLKKLRFLGKEGTAVIPPIDFEYNNTFIYDDDGFDAWNMFKSDVSGSPDINNKIKRRTSPTSYNHLDQWSLNKITTSLGADIKIQYEGDTYKMPELHDNSTIIIEDIQFNGNGTITLTLDSGYDIQNLLPVNKSVEIIAMVVDGFSKETKFFGNNTQLRVESGATSFENRLIELNNSTVSSRTLLNGKWEVVLTSNETVSDIPDESESTSYWSNTCLGTDSQGCQVTEVETTDYEAAQVIASNLVIDADQVEFLGGGLRVASIAIEDNSSEVHRTNYDYNEIGTGITSGVTAYEPLSLENALFDWPASGHFGNAKLKSETEGLFTQELNKNLSTVLAFSRELPAPNVLYGTVTVTESVKHGAVEEDLPGKVVYEFQTFEESMVSRNLENTDAELSQVNVTETILLPPPSYLESACPDGQPLTYANISPAGPDPDWVWDFDMCNYEEGNEIPGQWTNKTITTTQTIEKYNPIHIKDYSVQLGTLKKVTTYGSNGQNDILLSEILHDYLDPRTESLSDFDDQGVISQIFNEERMVEEDETTTVRKRVFVRKDEYPHILKSTTTIDHKTGVQSKMSYLAYDHFSGEATKVLSTDSYGNRYITESIPAYTISEYSGSPSVVGMGLKISNQNNKHMLTQMASTSTHKVNLESNGSYTNVGLVSASVQTWSDQVSVNGPSVQTGIWRKHQTYNWIGEIDDSIQEDGLYSEAAFTHFDAWVYNQNPSSSLWQRSAEINLYDVYSHVLEVSDLNDDYAATKMDLKQERVLASAALSKYTEMAYSGAEDWTGGDFGGGVLRNSGAVLSASVNAAPTHTGDKSMGLANGTKGFEFVTTDIREGKYRVSLWSSVSGAVDIKYQVNGGTESLVTLLPERQAGSWYLLRGNIDVPTGVTSFSVFVQGKATTHVDDFRFHPLQSAMTSYVYNEWGELSHILDTNNLFTEYEYDASGRLKAIYRERIGPGRLKVTEQEMNYQKSLN